MAAEYSTSVDQTIPAGGSAFFDLAPVPCRRGLIYHRDGGTIFKLASPALLGCNMRRCCCNRKMPTANYVVSFHGNVAIPTGGTVEAVTLALALDGEVDPASVMSTTPPAVEVFDNIGTGIVAEVPWICRCAPIALRNTSTQPVILRAGANITFDFYGVQY